jgi:xanthine dehydrogenase YagS FAD-binding subunit
MRPFAYSRPATIEEAIALLDSDARLLAGGTDLLTLMKGEIVAPAHLVDIKRLPDLDDVIDLEEGAVSIGALSTLAQLETDPLVQMHLPALAQAAAVAATPQLRNMATIGGNVLQRPRCWYFRNDDVHCWLKGGEECFAREGDNRYHALFGESRCVAVHPSDLAPVLVAYGALPGQRRGAGDRDRSLLLATDRGAAHGERAAGGRGDHAGDGADDGGWHAEPVREGDGPQGVGVRAGRGGGGGRGG